MSTPPRTPLFWIASSRRDLVSLPEPVRRQFGQWLLDVQLGGTPADAKALKGFHGAGVLELVEDYHTDTFRAVYTVNFPGGVYVLHVFQKKSTRGRATPRPDVALIRTRYQEAERHYRRLHPPG